MLMEDTKCSSNWAKSIVDCLFDCYHLYGVQVMTEAGPWHARLLQMGADHMALLQQQFMAGYPCPEHGPIEHFPPARLIMIKQSLAAL